MTRLQTLKQALLSGNMDVITDQHNIKIKLINGEQSTTLTADNIHKLNLSNFEKKQLIHRFLLQPNILDIPTQDIGEMLTTDTANNPNYQLKIIAKTNQEKKIKISTASTAEKWKTLKLKNTAYIDFIQQVSPANLTTSSVAIQPKNNNPQQIEGGNDNVNLFADETLLTIQQYCIERNWITKPTIVKDINKTCDEIRDVIHNKIHDGKIFVKFDNAYDETDFIICQDKITVPDNAPNKTKSYRAAADTLKAAGFKVVYITAPNNYETALKEAMISALESGLEPIIKRLDESGQMHDDPELHQCILDTVPEKPTGEPSHDGLPEEKPRQHPDSFFANRPSRGSIHPEAQRSCVSKDVASQAEQRTKINEGENQYVKIKHPLLEQISDINDNPNIIINQLLLQPFSVEGLRYETLLGAIIFHAFESNLEKYYFEPAWENIEEKMKKVMQSKDPLGVFRNIIMNSYFELDRDELLEEFKASAIVGFDNFFKDPNNNEIKEAFINLPEDSLFAYLREGENKPRNPPILGYYVIKKDFHDIVVGDNILGYAAKQIQRELIDRLDPAITP